MRPVAWVIPYETVTRHKFTKKLEQLVAKGFSRSSIKLIDTKKIYNRRDSPVVIQPTINLLVCGLSAVSTQDGYQWAFPTTHRRLKVHLYSWFRNYSARLLMCDKENAAANSFQEYSVIGRLIPLNCYYFVNTYLSFLSLSDRYKSAISTSIYLPYRSRPVMHE